MSMKTFFVYILASDHYGTLYIGMTSDLIKRLWEHQNEVVEGFSKKYDVKNLVYFEQYETFETAVKREKQMKAWKRQWKINLIEQYNPQWIDLSKTLSV